MECTRFVSYLRVSTARQGSSGLGLEAQREAVRGFLKGRDASLIEEFVEVESGTNSERPALMRALATSRIHKATLVVSKLDRLARNAHFLLGLKESGVDFVACDMPFANALTVGIMALVAQEEAKMISARTIAALEAVRARGVKLGSPKPITKATQLLGRRASASVRRKRAAQWISDVSPLVKHAFATTDTLLGAAKVLNAQSTPARRGGKWSAAQVKRVLENCIDGSPSS
ncbi:recombinase family protein [Gemmatimonas groenlandica]|uniref:Recombinase family protein n=1 Tax=Gemmatimonas groenlandica TaxID=2732249 RepID=A0A6M4IQV2_9BACT|nr:recombinase family protein [Gemmatimonas groenlandica]QJR35222.1 recombinase family protein [Gemmatimonas groenlandica]